MKNKQKKNKVYVIAKNGRPLMPTSRFGRVKHLLKSGKAKAIRTKPFTIKLLYDSSEYVQSLSLGLDTGSKEAAIVVRKDCGEVVYAAEFKIRSKEVSKKMEDRKMHRRSRRQHRRSKRKNCAKKQNKYFEKKEYQVKGMDKLVGTTIIKPSLIKFANRNRKKGWLTPTTNHLLTMHKNIVKFAMKLLPISESHIEYAKFDIQKLENEKIKSKEYQQGRLLGYTNEIEYVLCRDKHSCCLCKKSKTELHAHHVIWKEGGGSNNVENLVTLCKICHEQVHKNKKKNAKIKKIFQGMKKKYVATTMLNSIMPSFYQWLEYNYGLVSKVYGYETKDKRRKFNLEKQHYIDAYLIASNNGIIINKSKILKANIYQCQQFRRHNRQLIHSRRDRNYKHNKKIVAKNRNKRMGQTTDSLAEIKKKESEKYISQLSVFPGIKTIRSKNSNFKPGDIVKVKGKRQIVKGTGNKGYTVYLLNQKKYVLARNCTLIAKNTGIVYL